VFLPRSPGRPTKKPTQGLPAPSGAPAWGFFAWRPTGRATAYLWNHQRNIASLRRSVFAWLWRPRIHGTSRYCEKWPKLGGIWPTKKIVRKRPSALCHYRLGGRDRLGGRAHSRDGSIHAPSGGGWPSTVHLQQSARVPGIPLRSVCIGPTYPYATPRNAQNNDGQRKMKSGKISAVPTAGIDLAQGGAWPIVDDLEEGQRRDRRY
jgi:hypothetical protein